MDTTSTVVRTLFHQLARRDPATAQHSRRVARLALALGQARGLTRPQQAALVAGALLHDIGKLALPPALVRTPGPLAATAWDHMRQHPQLGARITRSLQLPPTITQIVMAHHERWDGGGYPTGCAGVAIPLAARMVAVADAYDAMTETRPYRARLTPTQACQQLALGAGRQWDAQIVQIALALLAHPAPLAPGAGHPTRVQAMTRKGTR